MVSDDPWTQFAYLEWAGLQTPWLITDLDAAEGIPQGSESIELWRDERYRVCGKLTGIVTDSKELEFQGVLGSLAQQITINGTDQSGWQYILRKGYRDKYKILHSLKEEHVDVFEASLSHFQVTRTRPSPLPTVTWLTEWYLNGVRDAGILWRGTHRELVPHYSRSRGDQSFQAPDRRGSFSGINDHVRVEYGNKSFVIQRVLSQFGPSWSRNLGIEYRSDWGGIPNAEERAAISEIVGLLIGRRLLPIGFTEYDEIGDPVTETATSPATESTEWLSQLSESPLVNINHYSGGVNIETLLQELVPRYLALRDSLRLSDAMWRYNLTRELPIGIDLPVIASAIEGIAAEWFKSNQVKRTYLEEQEYSKLSLYGLDIVEQRLEGLPASDRQKIMRKLRGAYSMGSNESLELFFDAVGLRTSRFEKRAIAARNPMAHGAPAMPRDVNMASKLRIAYQTLFVRLLLKLLSYNGHYIDYSTLGCPVRHIDEPQEGIAL